MKIRISKDAAKTDHSMKVIQNFNEIYFRNCRKKTEISLIEMKRMAKEAE